MIEIWKDIKGYEGLYRVSNLGRVLRSDKNRELKPNAANINTPSAKLTVNLCKGGIATRFGLNKLVYETFTGDLNHLYLEHKDNDYTNCSLINLSPTNDKTLKYQKSRYKRVLDTKSMKMHNSIKDFAKHIGVQAANVRRNIKLKVKGYENYKIID